jgi:hypothetical protein
MIKKGITVGVPYTEESKGPFAQNSKDPIYRCRNIATVGSEV